MFEVTKDRCWMARRMDLHPTLYDSWPIGLIDHLIKCEGTWPKENFLMEFDRLWARRFRKPCAS